MATVVVITISVLHIFTLIQSVETAVREGSVYSQPNNQNFFTDIFSGILYRLFPRNVQSSDQLDRAELRFLIQKRKQKQRLHNQFKKDILSMIAIKAIKRRKDKEDDINYKYFPGDPPNKYKPPKINYQRNGSKSEALKNLFNIAGLSDSNPGSTEREEEKEEFSCPESDGYFPAADCRYYYHCSHGSSRRLACSSGLGWNVKTNNCDWIHALSNCQY